MSLRGLETSELFRQATNGNRRALARLITMVERDGDEVAEITALAHSCSGNAHVVGITGAPGSGKSTLTGQLIKLLSEADKRVAVLAVDPSSPLTGGAILGDRVRMEEGASPKTFIRSMATRGHQGGLALAVPGVVRLLDACGYNPIIVETVGVGQVEVDVVSAADTTVVVATPGMGDSVQANKAGLLELADLFVVNKADRPGANDVRRDLNLMLDLSHATGHDQRLGQRPEIIMTTAISGEGAQQMWDGVERHFASLAERGELSARRARRNRAEVRHRLIAMGEAAIEAVLAQVEGTSLMSALDDRSLDPSKVASELAASTFVGPEHSR